MTPELRELIEELRTELAADLPSTLGWSQFNEGAAPDEIPADLPTSMRELLQVADGMMAGWFELASTADLDDIQFHIEHVPEFAPIADNPDGWLVFGTKNDEPLFMERETGAVWYFPQTGTEWFMGDTFEEIAPDLDSFVHYYVLGPGYGEIATTDDEWYEFLGQQGLLEEVEEPQT